MVIQFLISCVYFFLPAYFTNMAPPLAGRINILAIPVDFGKKLGGKPILGSHKTWRGVLFGLMTGISVAYCQLWLYQLPVIRKISFFDYSEVNILALGFLLSAGVLFGDMLFSFFKRRLNLIPGQPWLPFDQIDYVVGAFLFLTPYLALDITIWLTIFVLSFFLHIIFNRLGYWIGLHNSKW
ncbi:MAG: CDP-archaeol synthase [bacterium]